MQIGHLLKVFETQIPLTYRFENDPSGLLVGSKSAEIKSILISLDLSQQVIEEAIQMGVNLIITHHPLFYHPLKNLVSGSFNQDLIISLIKNNINLISLHTCFDLLWQNGISRALAEAINLENIKPFITIDKLRSTTSPKHYKVAVYTPKEFTEQIKSAIHLSGGAVIGNYDNCFFTFDGVGSFRGDSTTNPFIGESEKLTLTDEQKIETIVKEESLTKVISAIKSTHPYEEPAIDIYEVKTANNTHALGCIGTLPTPLNLTQLKNHLQNKLDSQTIRFAINHQKESYQTVAVVGGSGAKYWHEAHSMKADLYLTSEIDHHTALEAKEKLTIVDATHFTTEKFGLNKLFELVTKNCLPQISISISDKNRDPFEH